MREGAFGDSRAPFYQSFEEGGKIMDLLIKNGTLVTAKSTFKADLAVKNGKITSNMVWR